MSDPEKPFDGRPLTQSNDAMFQNPPRPRPYRDLSEVRGMWLRPTLITGIDLAADWFADLLRESEGGNGNEHRARRAIIAAAACLETHWFAWAQNRCMTFAAEDGTTPDEALRRVFPPGANLPSLRYKFTHERKHEGIYQILRFEPLQASDDLAMRLEELIFMRDVLLHGQSSRWRIETAEPRLDVEPDLSVDELRNTDFDWLASAVRDCIAYLYRDDSLNAPHWAGLQQTSERA